jgi:hypothetical protein
MWQRRNFFDQGDSMQSRGTHDNVEALQSKKTGSEVVECMIALKPSRVESQHPAL